MAMNIAVGIMTVIVVAAGVWCWWVDRCGHKDEKTDTLVQTSEEKDVKS